MKTDLLTQDGVECLYHIVWTQRSFNFLFIEFQKIQTSSR